MDRTAGEIRPEIRDTGVGIGAEERDKILERFYKIDRFPQGVELGLPICKLLAELLHGRLTVCSNCPRESVFTLILPLA